MGILRWGFPLCVYFIQLPSETKPIHPLQMQSATLSLSRPTEMSLLVSPCKVAVAHNDSWTYCGKGTFDSTSSHDYDEVQKEAMVFLAAYHSSCILHTIIKNPLQGPERAEEPSTAQEQPRECTDNGTQAL